MLVLVRGQNCHTHKIIDRGRAEAQIALRTLAGVNVMYWADFKASIHSPELLSFI